MNENNRPTRNLIQVPPTAHIKISLTIDSNTQQSEMKIERGRLTNLQLATVLLEHATHINRQLMQAEALAISKSSVVIPPIGGNNGAA
jgi:hypothetical protein